MQFKSIIVAAAMALICTVEVAAKPAGNTIHLREIDDLVARFAAPEPQFCDGNPECCGGCCLSTQCHIIKRAKVLEVLKDIEA
jgi:hypothetical protein